MRPPILCIPLAFLLVACREAGPDVAAFAGCYAPLLHPELDGAGGATGTRSWMRLDSTLEVRAVGGPAYRVGFDSSLARTNLWKGWWRPVGRDSVEVVWSTGTFSREYRLGMSGQRMAGRVTVSNDLGSEKTLDETVEIVRVAPLGAAPCAGDERR